MEQPKGGATGRVQREGNHSMNDARSEWWWRGEYVDTDGQTWLTEEFDTKAEALAAARRVIEEMPEWIMYRAYERNEEARVEVERLASLLADAVIAKRAESKEYLRVVLEQRKAIKAQRTEVERPKKGAA